jgi:predicted NAD/FAD-binding protein
MPTRRFAARRPWPAEREILGALPFQRNEAVLHTGHVAAATATTRLGGVELPVRREERHPSP